MQFDISLELCRAKIQQLSDYENAGLVNRDCNDNMKEYLYSYCLWLRSMYSVGSSIGGYKMLASSVSGSTEGELNRLMVDTVDFASNAQMDWLLLWNIHAFQYVNPVLWKMYEELGKKWFLETNSPT